MTRIVRCFFWCIALLLSWSCADTIKTPVVYLGAEDVDAVIDSYSDSSYFSQIRCMQYINGKIYALDVQRRDVAVLDTNLKLVDLVGRGGRGPMELISPAVFYVSKDTVEIIDFGSHGIKRFGNDGFISFTWLPNASEEHFFYTDSLYHIPAVTEENTFFIMRRNVPDSLFSYYGKIDKVRNLEASMLRNDRSLFYHPSGCYAVPNVLPYIEKYDLNSNELLEKFDLSEIEPYKSNLAFAKRANETDKSFHVLVNDSSLEGDDLFILCNVFEPQYSSNQIVQIKLLPQMRVAAVYQLPSDVYYSFCVSPTHFYVFDYKNAKIESIKRPL